MILHPMIDELILRPNELSLIDLMKVLHRSPSSQVDDADVYLHHTIKEVWLLEDGVIKQCSFDIDSGAGFQVFSGLSQVNTFTQDLSITSLMKAAKTANSLIDMDVSLGGVSVSDPKIKRNKRHYIDSNPLPSIEDTEKKHILLHAYALAKKKSKLIKQVTIRMFGQHEVIMVLDREGKVGFDIRPLVRLDVSVVLAKGGVTETGYFGVGGRYDYQHLVASGLPDFAVAEAIRIAELSFEASAVPAGNMPVVLGSGFTGVLLHEAIGHGLEGDFIRKKTSCFTDLLGKVVASTECNIVDNGTLSHARGSLNIDDEGTPTQCTELIREGKVVGFMYDKFNARLMKTCSTGNGRRESYQHQVMPRMTNTYMLNGTHSQSEMINSIDSGIFAVNFGGGQVDITSGQFVFSATESYKIEKGKITEPLKGVTLCGSGFEVLQKIKMVGNDLAHDYGVGTCGKDGQQVPVGVGQPSVLISDLLVGGTEL